jgi:hypothetical protein
VLIALRTLQHHLKNAQVVFYLDNDAARSALIRANGSTLLSQAILTDSRARKGYPFRLGLEDSSIRSVFCFRSLELLFPEFQDCSKFAAPSEYPGWDETG